MDTNKEILEHSKIKLELYRLYLERYLSVLIAAKRKKINVVDIFAGSGISKNNEKGSAVIAAEAIHSVLSSNASSSIKIKLILNDLERANCDKLEKHMQDYKSFASVECSSADDFIQGRSQSQEHKLFFIDPHGYTQLREENLKKLLSANKSDSLIFIPLANIFRFLTPNEDSHREEQDDNCQLGLGVGEGGRKVGANAYYKPIKKFLAILKIGEQQAQACNGVEEFADEVISGLRSISGARFVYCKMLDNKRGNQYGLFFISNHPLGADKFLEAQNTLEERKSQLSFDFIEGNNKYSLHDLIDADKFIDNVELYLRGLEHGIRTTEMNRQLRELEDLGQLQVEELPGQKRHGKAFYLGYGYYSAGKRVINIRLDRLEKGLCLNLL